MSLKEHIAKDKLHHAYLIEGERGEAISEILSLIENLGVKVSGNADVVKISTDSFKMEDARNLKVHALERASKEGKKFFIISANNFLLEAQNAMLKIFEEPIEDTHFFIVVPDAAALIKTFISRFNFISTKTNTDNKEAEKFLSMHLNARLEFIKELLEEGEDEDEEGNEIIVLNSARAKALNFLNAIESLLHSKIIKNSAVFTLPRVPGGSYADQNFLLSCFEQIFKVREFLRMPGSSAKTLMESLALTIPVL